MIAGIGTDIVDALRMRNKLEKNPQFKASVFSANEIAYCEKQNDSAPCFAARFAAKEALLKATGKGLQLTIHLNEIEVAHLEGGQPQFVFLNVMESIISNENYKKIHVSLSHDANMAIAFVVIEK